VCIPQAALDEKWARSDIDIFATAGAAPAMQYILSHVCKLECRKIATSYANLRAVGHVQYWHPAELPDPQVPAEERSRSWKVIPPCILQLIVGEDSSTNVLDMIRYFDLVASMTHFDGDSFHIPYAYTTLGHSTTVALPLRNLMEALVARTSSVQGPISWTSVRSALETISLDLWQAAGYTPIDAIERQRHNRICEDYRDGNLLPSGCCVEGLSDWDQRHRDITRW
jgi:hypothetical protein